MLGRAVRAGGGLDDETIFFPFSGDVHQMHSLLTLEGERRCLGVLSTCRFCHAKR